MVIRQATKNDAKAISSVLTVSQWFTYENLYTEAYIQKLIYHYYNIERIQEEIISITSKWHGYYVAERKGEVIGAIGGGMINEVAGEIYVFYLNPGMRGKGIGTRLLNYFTKIQKYTYGAEEQWVSVAKGNRYGIPFYEAKGFIFQHEKLAYGTTETDQDIALYFKRQIQ